MRTRRFFLLISNLIILLKINCNAWVIPMEKYDINEDLLALQTQLLSAQVEGAEFGDDAGAIEIPKDVIGIKIAKFTRQDPVMQIFDYDMDLAREFAYKQWRKLFSEYIPAFDLDVKVVTVTVPVQDGVTEVVTKSPKTDKEKSLANDINTAVTDVPGKLISRPVAAKLEHNQDAQQHSWLK